MMGVSVEIDEDEQAMVPVPDPLLLILDPHMILGFIVGLMIFIITSFWVSDMTLVYGYLIIWMVILVVSHLKNKRYMPLIITNRSIEYRSKRHSGTYKEFPQPNSIVIRFHQPLHLRNTNLGMLQVEWREGRSRPFETLGIYYKDTFNRIEKGPLSNID